MSKLDLKTLKISESEWQKAWRDVGARGRVDWFLKMAFDSDQMERIYDVKVKKPNNTTRDTYVIYVWMVREPVSDVSELPE